MSHLENFKGFSPLRTPDVLKFVKQKHKKTRHKENVSQPEKSDNESDINKDILKLASKVSGKLSRPKKDKFEFRSSDLPVDIDITPERNKRLNARLAGEVYSSVSIEPNIQLTSSQSDSQTSNMQEKSPKKHRKEKPHEMSDSDNDKGKVLDSVNFEEKVCGSPSILSGLDNTMDKSSSKKKHKSHKKHKKHKKHKDDSINVNESFMEQDDLDKSGVIGSPEKSSPLKNTDVSAQKQTNQSPLKQVDKSAVKGDKSPKKGDKSPKKGAEKSPQEQSVVSMSPKKRALNVITEHQIDNSINGVSDEDSEDNESNDNVLINKIVKFQVPEDFTPSDHATESFLTTEEIKGKELWLIKVPSDFDVSRLNGQEVSLDKLSHLASEDVTMDTFPVPGDITGVSLCPILSSKKSKQMSVGTDFRGQLHVMTSMEVPTLPKVKAPSPKHIATPENLRPRYVPFGADIPEYMCSETREKHKKSKKRKHSLDETDATPVKHKKKKKKQKH